VSGPEATGPEPADPAPADGTPADGTPADGTPADVPPPDDGGVFSLEGRAAPGLYLVAWLLGGLGLALAFIGLLAGPGVGAILLLAGLVSVSLGLASAAGYQVVARSSRAAHAYRGPSPILAFAVAFTMGTSGALILALAGLFDPLKPSGFLLGLLLPGAGYLMVVVLFVERTGALGWTEMGWPSRADGIKRMARDGLFGVAATVPVGISALVVAGFVAQLLGVEPPGSIPAINTNVGAVLVTLAAAVVAPLGEELFFRGFALTAWQREIGPRRALIRSAFFFALVHLINVGGQTFGQAAGAAMVQFVVILPLGFVLGWVFQRRGIAASLAGHAGYNVIVLVLHVLAR
jgi:membrane protease YdiL (CAAX protease family)